MATHSSILAWRIPQTEKPGGLQFVGLQRVDMTDRLTHCKGEGIVTATHCIISLELNESRREPRDGGRERSEGKENKDVGTDVEGKE